MRGETKELCYRIIQPTGKYKKHSLKSTNLINYTSSDKYNLGATLTQYNLTINYLEPIINLQLPLTQTHSRHCYHQMSWSHLKLLTFKVLLSELL